MFLNQPCCKSIKEVDFDNKGSETDAAGINIIYIVITSAAQSLQGNPLSLYRIVQRTIKHIKF